MSLGQAITPQIVSGLKLLLQARDLAKDLQRSIWEFAVEKENLNKTGTTDNDLRWLICRRIVEHAYELQEQAGPNRQFCTNAELALDSRSCFVLTDDGERLAQQCAEQGPVGRSVLLTQPPLQFVADDLTPIWDNRRHELSLGSTIVKAYNLPMPSQETILAAFEEMGWPPCIDNPLPQHPRISAKRQLHDAVGSLNRNQRYSMIRFAADTIGMGVSWVLTEA